VWAELASNGTGITTVSRVGIRMYLSVGEGAEPTSDFRVDTLAAQRGSDGAPAVQAQVENTGERALDMSGTLTLRDGPGGISAGPFAASLGTTLGVGGRSPVSVLLDRDLPAGPWTARLTLRSGELERAAEAVITFPDTSGSAASPVQAKNLPVSKDPKILVPVATGLIGLAALLLLLWRRRTRDDVGQREERVLVPAG
jgi:hypothetical protein